MKQSRESGVGGGMRKEGKGGWWWVVVLVDRVNYKFILYAVLVMSYYRVDRNIQKITSIFFM